MSFIDDDRPRAEASRLPPCAVCGVESSCCIWRRWLCLACTDAHFVACVQGGKTDTEADAAAWFAKAVAANTKPQTEKRS